VTRPVITLALSLSLLFLPVSGRGREQPCDSPSDFRLLFLFPSIREPGRDVGFVLPMQ
jgi:hypothetical protein